MWKFVVIIFIFLLILGVVVYAVINHYGNKVNIHRDQNNIHIDNKHHNPTTTSNSLLIEEQEYNNEMKKKRFYEYKASPLSYVYNVDLEKVNSQKDKFYWK